MNKRLHRRLAADYPEWVNNPLQLTNKEIRHPYRVLHEFFDCYRLNDCRILLREWLHKAMRPGDILEIDQIALYDHLLKLIEAGWLLHLGKKQIPPGKKNRDKKKDNLSSSSLSKS